MATINAVGNGLSGSTGTGAFVGATSPTLVTPALGTPSAVNLTNGTALPDGGLTLTDVTTNNATTSAHGFLKKLSNTATEFMNGQGNWAVPAGGGMAWVDQTGTSVTMAVNTGYVANAATLVTLTLPATSAVGSVIEVVGLNTGLWSIAQASGQTIHASPVSTTTGVGGSISAVGRYDTIRLVCVVADVGWCVTSQQSAGLTYV